MESVSEGGASALVGVGINLVHAPEIEGRKVGSLSRWCRAVPKPVDSARQLAANFAQQFALWQSSGFEAIRTRWLSLADGLNEDVIIVQDRAQLQGRFVGIDAQGALLLRVEGGTRAFQAGDVSLRGSVSGIG